MEGRHIVNITAFFFCPKPTVCNEKIISLWNAASSAVNATAILQYNYQKFWNKMGK